MYQAIVIDDEKWVVKSLIATIKNQEYFDITAEFYDGLSGLEYIRTHHPALAFVDVRLPGMGGLEILQAAHAEGLPTLFIMISGHAEFAYAQKAMFHNAIGYCLKPFSRNELMDSMQKAWQLLKTKDIQQEEDLPADTEQKKTVCASSSHLHTQIYPDDDRLYGKTLSGGHFHSESGGTLLHQSQLRQSAFPTGNRDYICQLSDRSSHRSCILASDQYRPDGIYHCNTGGLQ